MAIRAVGEFFFFFLVLFEIMGRGNLCVVEWHSKCHHDFSGTTIPYKWWGDYIFMCPVTLSNINSVLHRDHSNGFT